MIVADFNSCNVGTVLRFKSKSLVDPDGFFEGPVVGIYPHHVVIKAISINPDNPRIWGEAIPFNISISETQFNSEDVTIYMEEMEYEMCS